MTPYEILLARHADRIYKRGQYKGDAPMDKRGKSHFRIVKGESMYVRMYNTDILVAFKNGDFDINLNGYASSSTTRMNTNHTLGIIKSGMWVCNKPVMGLNQCVVTTPHGAYLYYDGIRFNQAGELVSTPQQFEAKRIDKSESTEFTDNLKGSGFKDMYPLLYATRTPPEKGQSMPRSWKDYIQDADYADTWPEIIEFFKYDTRWSLTKGAREWHEIDNAKACWARMMAKAKQDMYNTIRTEVTRLDV